MNSSNDSDRPQPAKAADLFPLSCGSCLTTLGGGTHDLHAIHLYGCGGQRHLGTVSGYTRAETIELADEIRARCNAPCVVFDVSRVCRVGYMDTQTVEAISAEVAREGYRLLLADPSSPEHDGQQAATPADLERLAYLRRVQAALHEVAGFLDGEHAAFHERKREARRGHRSSDSEHGAGY